MGEDFNESEALELPDSEAGEVFMLTFAAVGALTLLAADPAAAALPAGPEALTPEETEALLSGATAPVDENALGPPAATDPAFMTAFASLSPPAAAAPPPSPASQVGGGDNLASPDPAAPDPFSALPAPEIGALADDAVGSSTPPSAFGGLGLLVVHGDDLVVSLRAGETLVIGGADDLVLTSRNDAIEILSGSSVAVKGGGAEVTLAANASVSLIGVGYKVQATGAGGVVTVEAASQAIVSGDGVTVGVAAPDAVVTVIGGRNVVNVAAAGASVTVGGGDASAANSVNLNAGGSVNLMDASALAARGSGSAYLGADDYLSLFGAFEVFAQQKTGATVISAFGADDTLHVRSAFDDLAALLGAATEDNGATTLHLNGAGDTLTLAGLDKAQLTAFANSGHIRLD
jgi:hypothetical protein